MLRRLEDQIPWEFYEDVRSAGRAVWDDEMSGWLVADHDTCALILRDEDAFEPATTHQPGAAEIMGAQSIQMIGGPLHAELHRWMTQRFSRAAVDRLRPSLIDPIAHEALERLRAPGDDLVECVLRPFPLAVISAMLGLPPADAEAWSRRQAWISAILGWFASYGDDDQARTAASQSARELRDLLAPVVDAARGADDDGLVAGIWQAASGIPEVRRRDAVTDQCVALFLAGSGTVVELLSAVAEIVLTDRSIRRDVRSNEAALSIVVEETMRLRSPIHVRMRVANSDVHIGRLHVQKGQRVFTLIAAANRDPERYPDPSTFKLGRPGYASHLSFGIGPRHCPGASLARTEAVALIGALLQRWPDVELDPSAKAPTLHGLVSRLVQPLHITCSPHDIEVS